MTKDNLFNLLDEMSLPDTVINMLNTPHWRFWRKEEHLKRNEVFYCLREFIELRSQKSDKNIRENAYVVLAKLLLETFESECCQFLIDRLMVETDKYVLHTMLNGIRRIQFPADLDITAIIECSQSGEWLVRHNAIMVLGNLNTDDSREAIRYWVKQENQKQYKFELFYANAALGYIGEPSDITLLEKHTHSRIPDVKNSAIYEINNIKHRFEKNAIDEQ